MKRSGGWIKLLAATAAAVALNLCLAGAALAGPAPVYPRGSRNHQAGTAVQGWGGWLLPAIMLLAVVLVIGLIALRAAWSRRSSVGALSPADAAM